MIGVKASRNGPQISHLLFSYDCIPFGEANVNGVETFRTILTEYESCSGQRVNYDKFIVFYSSNTSKRDRRTISGILRVRYSNDPESYSGLPNMVGRNKKLSFQILKDRFRQMIENWSVRYLSQGGKKVFIKVVLQAIPTYSMACFLLPKFLYGKLESIMAKFWWQKRYGKKGIHRCGWDQLCELKENGVLGFKSLPKFNVALLAKQGWCILYYPNLLLV
ncbi:hypothetical protein PVK06_026583 [Gossypium arboreum]|uniref:Reverse transcriptase n=1 Tax=Gossypium arboreum TaxID=29729 RepID=A0ABR0NY21_GOSAR|nr:hypothetical protein PVK06_026583 [Gossypium arboreum]